MRSFIFGAFAVLLVSATAQAAPSDDDEKALAEMRATSRSVRELLRDTRKKGSKQAIACVDEALSRVDVATRAARGYANEARAADSRGDGESAAEARRRIAELRATVTLASRDARKCTPPPPPPPKVMLGTVVKLTVDPAIPSVNP